MSTSNSTMNKADLIVVGAGILGLAHAYHAAKKGYRVTVIERNPKACGASVQNFGMLIRAVQSPGEDYTNAEYGESIWNEIASNSNLKLNRCGALLVAMSEVEMGVLESFNTQSRSIQSTELLNASGLSSHSQIVNSHQLLGGLWLPEIIKVNQRLAMDSISHYLREKLNVQFHFNTEVTEIANPIVDTSMGKFYSETIVICPGSDLNTLFSDALHDTGISTCQLQMLRTIPEKTVSFNEPFILGGLSFARYAGFQNCDHIEELKKSLKTEYPEQIKYGIHVITAQEADGSMTIGDSHEYETGAFKDTDHIYQLILEYMNKMITLRSPQITERWTGQYSSLPGKQYLDLQPQPRTRLITITNGQGMTMSFSVARDIINSLF